MKLAAPIVPGVGVKVMVEGPVATAVPPTTPDGVTLSTVAPTGPMDDARLIAVAVL